MKRANQLFDKIVEAENLRLAFWKASRRKLFKQDVSVFQNNLESNLAQIRVELLENRFKFGLYNYFKVYDPKERIICAASFPERVVHHAIMNICEEYFEKYQIYDSYATRKGKGTHHAFERAKKYQHHYKIFLKYDVRKYFDSINHEVLKKMLLSKFKDKQLLNTFNQIIDSYSVSENKGLPIGNLTSQFFANFYLSGFDHYAKEVLQIKAYVRYMDDMVFWSNDKDLLLKQSHLIENYISGIDLTLKPKIFNYTNAGLPFIGYRLFSDRIRLTQRSKIRFIRKVKSYNELLVSHRWSEKEYQMHLLPLIDFVSKADSYELRSKLFKGINRWALTV